MSSTEPMSVNQWLTDAGWSPTRDIGSRAEELIGIRIADAARQGHSLSVIDPAVEFIHSYGDLELSLPKTSPQRVLILKPTIGYDGDIEDFEELSENLGLKLFPVAFESIEGGIWLIDESSRMFYLHHTGGYFLGAHPHDAFVAAFEGRFLADAEDYFA
ncbi:SUKH-3 domain-containing protein [Nocardia acidivorans]|uniref:SUKH-3 domain-containing protein n=1 Tax=Nocardia acidivorans TaxID=404580 RepID=UPI0009FD2259|nr:SUKH-3 domain-containing protein [Nocardia acidivorans]